MKWVACIGCLLAFIRQSNADGWILFQNLIDGTVRPVLQQNGSTVAAPFVAQLYMQQGDWVPVSQPAKFRSSPFPQAGIFAGGTVVIPGDYGGTTVTLKVRVWDGQHYSSYEEALERWSAVGESEPFTETLARSPAEPAKPMRNFKPFMLFWDDSAYCTVMPTVVLSHVIIHEGQNTAVDFPPRSCNDRYPDVTSVTAYSRNPTNPIDGALPGLSLGTLHGVWSQSPLGNYPIQGPPFTYAPNTNTYGTDYIYSETCCQLGAPNFGSRAIAITILPSPARSRPTLFLSVSRKPFLLGLNAREYRIDRSTDLKTWDPAGTVTGNYSTVDLSSFVNAGASAHFLRATDITPP